MEPNKHTAPEVEKFPTLESLRGTLHLPAPSPAYQTQFENQVMQSIALRANSTKSNKRLAPIIISFTWFSVAAACFLLTFHFNPEEGRAIFTDNEYTLMVEELTQASEIEIQEWFSEAQPTIQDEEIINELSEYDVYAE